MGTKDNNLIISNEKKFTDMGGNLQSPFSLCKGYAVL